MSIQRQSDVPRAVAPVPGRRVDRASRFGRVGLAALLAASAALNGVAPAMAAGQAIVENVPIETGVMPIETFDITWISFEPIPFTIVDVDISVSAEWNADVTTAVGWDSDEVRQGADLDVSRFAPLTTGQLTAHWSATGNIGLFGGNADINIGTHTDDQTVQCNPKVSGASFTCHVESAVITIHPGTGPGSTYVKLGISTNFEVTPEGIAIARSLSVGNQDVAGPDQLPLPVASSFESFAMPCTALPGDPVEYALNDYSWTPSVEAEHKVIAYVGLMDPLTGTIELPAIGTIIGESSSSHEFALSGNGKSFPLGALKANDVVPTIDPMGPFAGAEGSPIQFSATTDSGCPIASRVWQFSNGTTSFGPAPQRAFGDDGLFDGQLTVTDVTGLSATRSFDVSVSNKAPAVNAGPDTSADWGRPVAFTGQATDPGWLDQPTLQFAWEFGDGSPSASGGANVTHQYATPGVYGAAFQVCDKDDDCATDSRAIIVTKRSTSLGYTGPTKAGVSKTVPLTAVLVDEYGQPVVGKKITFALGSQTAIGTSDGNGVASVSLKLTQKQGSYPLNVTFPVGDAKYLDSADLGDVFIIGK